MKLNEIQDLIKFVSKSGVNEVELETKEIKIVIKTGKQNAPLMVQAAAQIVQAAPTKMVSAAPVANPTPVSETKATPTATNNGADESKYITIKSPMIGTFYRSPGPDKASFVNVGDEVDAGKTVCIIEAMKFLGLAAAVGLASSRCDVVAPGIDAHVVAATDAHRPDLADKLRRIGLLCLGELQRWPELLDAARRTQRDAVASGSIRSVPELAILAAIAAVRSGDPDEAQRLLDDADSETLYVGLRLDLALTRRMLGLPDTVLPTLQSDPEPDTNDPALPHLVRAFVAYGDGDIAAAKEALADARRDGIRESLFAMHSAWLGRQLGETDASAKRMPMLWYPPTSRWATRW